MSIYRWLGSKISNAMNSSITNSGVCAKEEPMPANSNEWKGTRFILYPAVGGNILEIRPHERYATIESECKLHLIPSNQDLGESIGRIITYEMLLK